MTNIEQGRIQPSEVSEGIFPSMLIESTTYIPADAVTALITNGLPKREKKISSQGAARKVKPGLEMGADLAAEDTDDTEFDPYSIPDELVQIDFDGIDRQSDPDINNDVKIYLSEIAKVKLLTTEQERELGRSKDEAIFLKSLGKHLPPRDLMLTVLGELGKAGNLIKTLAGELKLDTNLTTAQLLQQPQMISRIDTQVEPELLYSVATKVGGGSEEVHQRLKDVATINRILQNVLATAAFPQEQKDLEWLTSEAGLLYIFNLDEHKTAILHLNLDPSINPK